MLFRSSINRLYYMRPDYFNLYRDLGNFIESTSRGFDLYASGMLNPLGVFKCISLSSYPYKYVLTTSIKCISSPLETDRLIKIRNVVISITGEYVSS